MHAGLREAANRTEAHEEPMGKMGSEGWVIRLHCWLDYQNSSMFSVWEIAGCRPRIVPSFCPGHYFFSGCRRQPYEMHRFLRARRESLHFKE